ncbi:MAG TPA: hypothetical protein VII52_02970, partial [Gemmatimonadaceae bacterium]
MNGLVVRRIATAARRNHANADVSVTLRYTDPGDNPGTYRASANFSILPVGILDRRAGCVGNTAAQRSKVENHPERQRNLCCENGSTNERE